MSITSQVPDAGTPIFDDRGYINPVWHSFFFMLLRRTGGTEGIDPVEQEQRVDELERRANETEVYEYSEAPNVETPEEFDLGYAWNHGAQTDPLHHAVATAIAGGFMSSADKTKLDGITPGAAVASVSGTAPIVSSGGTTPAISITAATGGAAGSMSASDKAKLDGITSGAAVASVSGTAPIVSSGGTTPAISISAATGASAGSMSAADKTIIDAMTTGGTWTPILTFQTPGNLAVTYSFRVGGYTKIGRQVFANFIMATSSFTWTTSAGALKITGFPFASGIPTAVSTVVDFQGITMAGYTQISGTIANGATEMMFVGNASGLARNTVTTTHVPTGGTVLLSGTISYYV